MRKFTNANSLIRLISVISVISVLSVLSVSCSHKDKIPHDILPKEKMEAVLWDLLRAGEFLDGYGLKDSSIDKAAKEKEWYDNIFRLHKVTRKEFEKSYVWYQRHPVIMKQVLDSLTNIPVTSVHPPGQDTSEFSKDSSRLKDSMNKNKIPIILPGQHKPGFNVDSLRRAGRKETAPDTLRKKPLFFPNREKSVIRMDSIRKARLQKMIKDSA